jgi:hypothetical protein
MDHHEDQTESSEVSEKPVTILATSGELSKPRRPSIVNKMKSRLRKMEVSLNEQRSNRRLRRKHGSASNRAAAFLQPTPISPIPEAGTTVISEDCSSLTSVDDYLYVMEGEDNDDDYMDIDEDNDDGNTAGNDLFAGAEGTKNGEFVHLIPNRSKKRRGGNSTTEHRVALFSKQEPPESFPEAVVIWLETVDTLVRSEEMANVVGSSCYLMFSAGNLAVKTVCLPVTVPLHIAYFTTDIVLGSCAHVTGSLAEALLGSELKDDTASTEASVEASNQNPIQEIFGKVIGAPGFFLGVAGNMLGSAAISLAGPVLGMQQQQHPQLTAQAGGDRDRDLDRLRLDYGVPQKKNIDLAHPSKEIIVSTSPSPPGSAATTTTTITATLSETSMFLLRVDDLDIKVGGHVFYIDLNPKYSSKPELSQSLQRLVSYGLSLMANHPTVRMGKTFEPLADIEWHPEGSSKKLLRKMADMKSIERLKVLEKDHLIWSGEFKNKRQQGFLSTDYTFFLARGIIRKSPKEFLNLLWDNNRTGEYNNFCLGRNTLLAIDDNILSDPEAKEGTKVIESETRVPFTGKSVKITCIMHVRPLELPDQGFVIVSRSLDSGMAGTHVGSRENVDTAGRKNEIIWGINVVRRVPNNPQLTDLTSLSQVGSPMVPKFLAQRIGVMGVEDFYKNVREPKTSHEMHRSETC